LTHLANGYGALDALLFEHLLEWLE
jgi:hypothetical protein